MRTAIVVAMALLPTLIHAQAPSPAITQSSPSESSFEARLTLPAEPGQSAASDFDSIPAPKPLRISTGVVAPEIVSTVEIANDDDPMWRAAGTDKTVVVTLTVDKDGKPSNLKIAKSAGDQLDEDILASVAQYRFKPGKLNDKPTAVDVNLEVIVHAPVR